MKVPHTIRIGALVLATTGFYAYVGQMVPQKEVQPPRETTLGSDMTTADMVKVGREIMEGKGICLTCHTIGKTGALRFPDLAGVDVRAKTRVPGLNDVEYFAQSMYEPTAFVVPGFPPAMPPIHEPPIGLTDQEILCVIAALQTLGGTPTVTMQTKHHYNSGAAAPGGAPAPAAAPAPGAAPDGAPPAAPPTKGAHLRPVEAEPQTSDHAGHSASPGSTVLALLASRADVLTDTSSTHSRRILAVKTSGAIQPVVAHQAARLDGAPSLAEARQGAGGSAR